MYAELAAKGTTTEQYRLADSVVEKRAAAGKEQVGVKAQHACSFAKCTNCPKHSLLFNVECPSVEDMDAFESAISSKQAIRGVMALPPTDPLHRLGFQVQHSNTCAPARPMGEAYYSNKIPKTECFPKLPWPLLCYHCGSDGEVQTPESLRTAFPQCSACRHKKVRP